MTYRITNTALDQIVTFQTEKVFSNKDPKMPYIGLEHMAQGGSRLLGLGESSSSISVNSIFRQNDILFGKLRPNLKKSTKAPFAGYCSTDILVLRTLDGVLPSFAAYIFQWERVFAAAVATAVGTKMPRTSWNDLKRFKVFMPDSSEEQTSIVYILDTIDGAIAKTEAVIAKLKQVRAGLLHDLLHYGLDENGRLRDPIAHPEQFKDSPLGRIPVDWNFGLLSQFVPSAEYGISTSLGDRGYSVLRMNNLSEGEAELSDLKYSAMPIPDGLWLRSGDVLFNRTNSWEHVGRTGIWRGQIERATFASYLVRLNPRPDLLNAELLNFWLNWPPIQIAMRRFATPAVQQVNINPTNLRQMLAAFPQNLKEQSEIVERIGQQDNTLRTEISELAKLKNIKSGLQDDLLTGRVRVPETLMEGVVGV
jgi:type I restriction enzyme, S subunit